jgi:hypothetical protein
MGLLRPSFYQIAGRIRFPQLLANGDTAGLVRLAAGLVFSQDDRIGSPINVGNPHLR